MKFSLLLSCLFTFQTVLTSQSSIGYFLTPESETIEMFKRDDDKKYPKKVGTGCDCQKYGGHTFAYIDKEGNAQEMNQSDLAKVFLKTGNRYCLTIETIGLSGIPRTEPVVYDIKKDTELIALSTNKKNKSKDVVLQSLFFSSPEYKLTLFQKTNVGNLLYIYSVADNSLVDGEFAYATLGIGRGGKKNLATIKRYFKDCPAIIEMIEETERSNKAAKRFERVPVLRHTFGMSCK